MEHLIEFAVRRFLFNVIKLLDLWIQEARTWSMFIFNYCTERLPSRCLYLQHSNRRDQGPWGEGWQIVTLVNSSLKILSRGLGFDPVTKDRALLEQAHQWLESWPGDLHWSRPLLCRYLCHDGERRGHHCLLFIFRTVLGYRKKAASSDVKDKHT